MTFPPTMAVSFNSVMFEPKRVIFVKIKGIAISMPMQLMLTGFKPFWVIYNYWHLSKLVGISPGVAAPMDTALPPIRASLH